MQNQRGHSVSDEQHRQVGGAVVIAEQAARQVQATGQGAAAAAAAARQAQPPTAGADARRRPLCSTANARLSAT